MITDHMKLDEQGDAKFKEECQALYNVIRKKKQKDMNKQKRDTPEVQIGGRRGSHGSESRQGLRRITLKTPNRQLSMPQESNHHNYSVVNIRQ